MASWRPIEAGPESTGSAAEGEVMKKEMEGGRWSWMVHLKAQVLIKVMLHVKRQGKVDIFVWLTVAIGRPLLNQRLNAVPATWQS